MIIKIQCDGTGSLDSPPSVIIIFVCGNSSIPAEKKINDNNEQTRSFTERRNSIVVYAMDCGQIRVLEQ